jgi:hypothetical protein
MIYYLRGSSACKEFFGVDNKSWRAEKLGNLRLSWCLTLIAYVNSRDHGATQGRCEVKYEYKIHDFEPLKSAKGPILCEHRFGSIRLRTVEV